MIRATALTTIALLALPAAAQAAGTTTINIGGAAANSLRSQGVRTIAVPPARATRTTWALPFAGGGNDPRRHLGGLILQRRSGAKTSRLVLTGLQLRTTGAPGLTALLAGRRVTLLTFASSRLGSAVLSRSTAATIRRRLGLQRTPQGRLGILSSTVTPPAPSAPASQPAGDGGTPAPVVVPVPQPPTSEGGPPPVCAAAGTAPASEPPRATRPPSAVDVTSAGITWHVRDSFTNYIATGEGTTVADGAVAAPASGTPPLLRDVSFPLRDGWLDPGSGAAALRFSGCVRFAYAGHGIQIDAQEPEIELAAPSSRAIFRFSGSSTKPGRAVLANLTLTPPTVGADGHTRTWTELAGAIPSGAATSVFAGFYFPGDPFGWFSVSVTT